MKPYLTAQSVQNAFYEAFAQGDFAVMSALWCDGPESLCIHPAGDVLKGAQAVLASWRAILAGGGAGRIEFESLGNSSTDGLALFTGYEHITPPGSRSAYPPVLATNVYRKVGRGWQMLAHHASPIAQARVASGATRH